MAPQRPPGPRPYHEGKDVGGACTAAGLLVTVSFWTWPAIVAAFRSAWTSVRASASATVPGVQVGAGARHSWSIVPMARMRKNFAVGDRDRDASSVLEPALSCLALGGRFCMLLIEGTLNKGTPSRSLPQNVTVSARTKLECRGSITGSQLDSEGNT